MSYSHPLISTLSHPLQACENLQPHVMQALARQIKSLATAPPEGIKYIPTESLTEIHAQIEGPTGTPYQGGTFQLKLVLGNEYPTAPPKGECIKGSRRW